MEGLRQFGGPLRRKIHEKDFARCSESSDPSKTEFLNLDTASRGMDTPKPKTALLEQSSSLAHHKRSAHFSALFEAHSLLLGPLGSVVLLDNSAWIPWNGAPKNRDVSAVMAWAVRGVGLRVSA